jgi:predicted SAM-dependent methyltransferase
MDNILRTLTTSQIAVDLGCGGGSFHYDWYQCRIIGIDIALNGRSLYRDNQRVQYVRSQAIEIPLADRSVDAVICNNTFEHFVAYKTALREIDRVLKHTGALWISVPNGYGFDDGLYRYIFSGGGHVNRFTFDRIVEDVHSNTTLRLTQSTSLFSGFGYLKKPDPELKQHFPKSAQFLFDVPAWLNKAAIFSLNVTTRLIDKLAASNLSQYGFGFVFTRGTIALDPLQSYFNVCWKCGSGNDGQYLKTAGRVTSGVVLRLYNCANCQARNIFFEPPKGLS